MIFIETPIFTDSIQSLMPDEAYADLQGYLAEHPEAGTLIKDTGGLRKVRWGLPNTGKRGGVRVIYYWRVAEDQILMLMVYPKSVQDDLTPAQKQKLRQIVEKW